MRKFILSILLLVSINTYSQSTKTKEAVLIADSILKSQIGERLFQYFILSEGSYYSYEDRREKQWTGKFLEKNRLPKSFVTLHFLYHFDYPNVKGIRGGLWLIVDNNFKLIDTLNFEFIPRFITEDKPLDFISVDSALTIAKSNSKPNIYKVSIPTLAYNEKLKQYIYTSSHDLTVVLNSTGKDIGEFEIIKIDAKTGNLINISKGYKGIVIR
ncbi:hypothetical protein [Hymenobacter guriensis]|uniref:PepSY domain-containing protein n=1 Tax=Hymenobacter guriensis TaxID=2793065 RepID=A0ABS0KZK5_9BACT|nr:hypothetical protein [Hymenobacter guriensis]MBG8553301.1 hypothetical protein [Hymenobacter guriensis]